MAKNKPGPNPERLKIEEDKWEDAVKRSLKVPPEKRKPKQDKEKEKNGGEG